MTGEISPSMMCVNLPDIRRCLDVFAEKHIEYLHIDIMDGHFVPNFTLGTDYVRSLRKMTDIPLDIHFMVEKPEDKLEWFSIREGDYVSVHYESTPHIQRAVARVRDMGAKPILAINPATPVSALEYLIDDIQGVLVMTVNPGFSGQKLIPQTLHKIREIRSWLAQTGRSDVKIEVDGNVSFENAAAMRRAGADIFVAGTSSIFADDLPLDTAIDRFRQAIA